MLASFMEARNIRWGELVGGMLIVFCSAALVVSFWSHIEQTPVLKFFLFTAVTAVLFGLGLYTEHRWKLPLTSRGVLLIATMLVPLDLLAIAAFGESAGMGGAPMVIGEGLAVGLFACLLLAAARVITPPWAWPAMLGVIAAAASQLVLRRVAHDGIAAPGLLAWAAMPMVPYLLAGGAMLHHLRRWREPGAAAISAALTLLGVTAFAAVVALGLLVFKSGDAGNALKDLALWVAALGMPAVMAGLLIRRHAQAPAPVTWYTAGTAVAVLGAVVMLAALGLAWPQPIGVAPLAMLNAAVLLGAAWRLRMPWAHLPAGLCLLLTGLCLFHISTGRLAWHDTHTAAALVCATTGPALVAFAAAFAGAGALLRRSGRLLEGRIHFALAGGVALLSLMLVTGHGLGRIEDHGATYVYVLYTVAAALGAWRLRHPAVAWGAGVLLLVTIVQGLVYRFAPDWSLATRWHVALLTHAALMALTAWLVRTLAPDAQRGIGAPPLMLALMTSSAGALGLLAALAGGPSWSLALRWLWLAGIWFALLPMAPALLFAAQAALTAAVLIAVGAWCDRHAWFAGTLRWLHPWCLQSTFVALALLGAAWSMLRRVVRSPLLHPRGAQLDQVLCAAAMLGLVLLVGTAILPGVLEEHATSAAASEQAYDAFGRWPVQALGQGAWWALAALLGAMLAGLGEGRRALRWIGIELLGAVACTLVAAHWMGAGAVASALKWCFAGLLVAGSLPFWWPRRDGGHGVRPIVAPAPHAVLLAITAPVVLLLSLLPMILIVTEVPMIGPVGTCFFGRIGPIAASVVPLLAVSAALGGHARVCRSTLLAVAAAAMANVAATTYWLLVRWPPGTSAMPGAWIDLVHVNLVALGACGAVSLAASRIRTGRPPGLPRSPWAPTLHGIASIALVLGLSMTVLFGLGCDAAGRPLPSTWPLPWLAFALAAALCIAHLWEPRAAGAPAGLFVLGLVGLGTAVDGGNLTAPWLAWCAPLLLVAHACVAAAAWRWRATLAGIAGRQGMTVRGATVAPWLTPALTVLVGLATVIAFGVVLELDATRLGVTAAAARWLRLVVAASVLAGAVVPALLAHGVALTRLRTAALLLAVAGVTAIGWAMLDPDVSMGRVLDRAVMLMVIAIAAVVAYGVGLPRLRAIPRYWSSDAARAVPVLVVMAAAALVFVLGAEVYDAAVRTGFDTPVAMSRASVAAVIGALLAATLTLIHFAVSSTRMPMVLSDAGRTRCVYAAEALLALLFLHVRLTMPYLFSGRFRRYWPLIVMLIAFSGVGLSEWFRRRNQPVLARPLERTGVFLPLLPVLGFWALSSEVHYTGLLLAVGLLYGVLAVLRRAFGFGLLAALAANGGLWYFLHDTEHFKLWQHPQVWLIPPALSALAAAHLSRERLSETQLTALRYGCLMVIYVSSTVDIFIRGVAASPWLPIVLAMLSVAGVLSGIMLRVRSLLFVGSAFLLLALVTMIWHASAMYHMTWLWYVSGICLGSAIITMFAIFEKKRARMLAMLDDLRQWGG